MFISASCKAAITTVPKHFQIFRSLNECFTMDPELFVSPVDILTKHVQILIFLLISLIFNLSINIILSAVTCTQKRFS